MVAIVNQALVDRYFPKANSIGKKMWFDRKQSPIEIIGVVTNGRTSDLTQAAEPEVYLSLWQASAFSPRFGLSRGLVPNDQAGRGVKRAA